jgi:hypothetical protein
MALRDVNLIPADIVSRRYVVRHITVWVICLAAILGLIWGGYVYARQVIQSRGAVAGRATVIEAELREVIASILRVQGELEGLSFVNALLDRRPATEVLWTLAELMNDDTHLESLQMGGAGGSSQLSLTGFSASNTSLGDFVSRLTKDPMFARVDLKYSRELGEGPPGAGAKPATVIRFEIACQIAEP